MSAFIVCVPSRHFSLIIFLFLCVFFSTDAGDSTKGTSSAGNVKTKQGENFGYGAAPPNASKTADPPMSDDEQGGRSYIAGRSRETTPETSSSSEISNAGSDIGSADEEGNSYFSSGDENGDDKHRKKSSRVCKLLKDLKTRDEEVQTLRDREAFLKNKLKEVQEELQAAVTREGQLKQELEAQKLARERQGADYEMLKSTFDRVQADLHAEKQRNAHLLASSGDDMNDCGFGAVMDAFNATDGNSNIGDNIGDFSNSIVEEGGQTYVNLDSQPNCQSQSGPQDVSTISLPSAFSATDEFNGQAGVASTPLMSTIGRSRQQQVKPFTYDSTGLPANNEEIYNLLRTMSELSYISLSSIHC